MKVLKALFITAAALAGALAVIGLLLPGRLQAERSIEIAAAPDLVYGYVAGFRRFNEWSPWADLDPDAQYTVSGPGQGSGARMEWSSKLPKVGSGSQEVVSAESPREVIIRLVFDGQGEALSTVRLEGADAGTRASWRFDMDLGMNPVNRWIGLIVADSIAADYGKGLSRLKALVEADVAAAAAAAAIADEVEVGAEVEDAAEAAPTPDAS